MKLYVVKHGETMASRNLIVTGRTDASLNDIGRKQTQNLGEWLKSIKFKAIYTSPMKRAIQTVDILRNFLVTDHHGKECPVIVDSRLVEQDYGELEGVQIYDNEYQWYESELFMRFPGGESYLDVAARIYPFLDEICEKYGKSDNVLTVTHLIPCKIIETYFDGMLENRFRAMQWDNCEVREYSKVD